MKIIKEEFLNEHRKAVNTLLVFSIILFAFSAVFLAVSLFHAKANNAAPLTYCISLPEPPEGAVLPGNYEIIIPAEGNAPDNIRFSFEQKTGQKSSAISMNYNVEAKREKRR